MELEEGIGGIDGTGNNIIKKDKKMKKKKKDIR